MSDQTIQSLQKIESVVERLSSDTGSLIKAAWDKMLEGTGATRGTPPSEAAPLSEDSAKRLAAGIAAEMRRELTPDHEGSGQAAAAATERIQSALTRLEERLFAELNRRQGGQSESTANAVERVMKALSSLSPEALEVVRAIQNCHVDQAVYDAAIADSVLKKPIDELRSRALLVPVIHDGQKGPVYYFRPGDGAIIRAVLMGFPPGPSAKAIKDALASAGYHWHHKHPK